MRLKLVATHPKTCCIFNQNGAIFVLSQCTAQSAQKYRVKVCTHLFTRSKKKRDMFRTAARRVQYRVFVRGGAKKSTVVKPTGSKAKKTHNKKNDGKSRVLIVPTILPYNFPKTRWSPRF